MHELSIAYNLVNLAEEVVRSEAASKGKMASRVSELHMRLGRLAGVAKESLLFCYDVITIDTCLAGSKLVIDELPVVIHCVRCGDDIELPGIQSFRCPRCGTPSGDVRQGREMELLAIHFDDELCNSG